MLTLSNVEYQFNTKYSNNIQSHYVKLTLRLKKFNTKILTRISFT